MNDCEFPPPKGGQAASMPEDFVLEVQAKIDSSPENLMISS
jgi:hypothetical protein